MSDRVSKDLKGTKDEGKFQPIDAAGMLLDGGPSVSARFRVPTPSPEQGPPPTTQPRSNRDKFPDTNRDWWPTDAPITRGPSWPYSKEDAPGGWGVHWYDNPPPRPVPPVPVPPDKPPVPPDKPPTPPGPVPDGTISRPDQIQPPRMNDEDARKSVNINADARSIYLTAGITGAGMGTGVHFADIYTGSIAPEARTGAVAFWRNNLSPSQRLVPGRSAALQAIEAQLPELRTTANATEHTFARQMRYRAELGDGLMAQIPSGPLPDTERAWYNARVDLVRDNRLFRAENIMANAGTQAEVDARQRLFTQLEASQMSSQANDFWAASRGSQAAQAALAEVEAGRNRAAQLLVQAERGSITTSTEAFLRGTGQGLLLASGTVLADCILDKALGNSPDLSNQAHWGVQGIGMPLLLLSRYSLPTKAIGALAMVGTSHLMDQYLGPPTGMFSAFARPSLPEIGLATAGALIPVQDMRLRAGLAVGGWALGKAWNYLDARYELTGRTEPRLRDETIAAVDMDMKSPSSDRFLFAADQMRKFSDRNDAASAVLVKDFFNSSSSAKTSIEKERGSAALMMGYGESMLARGSRIDQKRWDKDGERMLAGLDYDLGGEATNYLRAASGNLQDALKLARENKGKQISSGTVDDAYTSQLESLQAAVNKDLDKVYGRHDLTLVLSEVKKQLAAHPEELKAFGENLNQYAKNINESKEARFKSKISRDLAILHIAFGDADPTSGGQSEHMRNAQRYMEQAFNLDPNAADNPQLLALMNPALRK